MLRPLRWLLRAQDGGGGGRSPAGLGLPSGPGARSLARSLAGSRAAAERGSPPLAYTLKLDGEPRRFDRVASSIAECSVASGPVEPNSLKEASSGSDLEDHLGLLSNID